MRRVVVFAIVLSLLSLAPPALARHPHEEAVGCGQGRINQLHLSGDGEGWICKFDERLDLYYWEPVDPPEGETVYASAIVPIENDYHFILSRTEWVRGRLYTGSDVYVRRPLTAPLHKAANEISVYSRLFRWDGSSWKVCRNSGWSYNHQTSESHVRTFNWGTGPCGSGYYGSYAWGAHSENKWLVCGPLWSGYVHATGASASGQSGIQDSVASIRPPDGPPPPGHLPRPPKPFRAASANR